MPRLSSNLADDIVKNCLAQFIKLPKSGKPTEAEWTVLSCVVQLDAGTGIHEVVSLGTGSKCIGASRMSAQGDVLNDSHAEVIARRGFLLYLYDNISNALEEKCSVFKIGGKRLKMKDNIEFILYSSQLPCGDASIIPKSEDNDDFGTVLKVKDKFDSTDEERPPNPKRFKSDAQETPTLIQSTKSDLEDINSINLDFNKDEPKLNQSNLETDIHRTGAKCLPNSEQDPKKPGVEYHCLGEVRTKPGRGDRTLSVSCSDKIARWIHLGIEGALLNLLCNRIHIKHFIFGAGVPFSTESLNRAFLKRDFDDFQLDSQDVPEFYQSGIKFLHLKNDKNYRPAPGSIIWTKSQNAEIAVQGKKQGVTKKNLKVPQNFLSISKYKLYEKFLKILQKHVGHFDIINDHDTLQNIPYNVMKRKSKNYAERWAQTKEKFFKTWTVKPDMWNFTIPI